METTCSLMVPEKLSLQKRCNFFGGGSPFESQFRLNEHLQNIGTPQFSASVQDSALTSVLEYSAQRQMNRRCYVFFEKMVYLNRFC